MSSVENTASVDSFVPAVSARRGRRPTIASLESQIAKLDAVAEKHRVLGEKATERSKALSVTLEAIKAAPAVSNKSEERKAKRVEEIRAFMTSNPDLAASIIAEIQSGSISEPVSATPTEQILG